MSDETSTTLEALLADKYPNLRRAQRAQAQASALAQEASGSQDVAFSIQEDPRTGVYCLRQVAEVPAEPHRSPDPGQDPVRMKATATTTGTAATGNAKGGTKSGPAAGKKS